MNVDCVELTSSGRKWAISNRLMRRLSANFTEKNRFGEQYFDLQLPGLTLRVCYRRPDFITVEGDRGYIGLSRHRHEWHIGTPAFAMSRPLIAAMKRLEDEGL